MGTVLEHYRREIEAFNTAWIRRVADLFGRDQQQYLLERIGQAKKADAYDTFLNVIRAWIEFRAGGLSTLIINGMLDRAKDALQEGVAKGWGADRIATELVNAMGGTIEDATRIARTEVHTASSVASDQAARSTGMDMIKEWSATGDKRTRETHLEADGQRREMDESFDVGGWPLAYPGDPSGPPEEVINCRCAALYHPRINGEVFD